MKTWRVATTFFAALGLAACGGDFESIGRPHSGQNGKVRLVNATSANILLDLYDSGSALEVSVPIYGASGYSSLATGNHTLTVRNSSSTAAIATTTVTAARDDYQAVVAYSSGGVTAATVLSETDAAPAAGTAKLRILNTADAGSVDVYVVTTTCAVNATATTPAFASAVGSNVTAYAAVPASATASRVCITGAGARTDLRADIASLAFFDQRIVTLILVRPSAGVLKALALDQQAAPPAFLPSTP
jgi:hypothetical protein